MVTAATARMSTSDLAAVLVKTKLSKAQQMQILLDRGISKEEAEATLATAAHTAANATATTVTGTLTSATTGLKVALNGLKAAFLSNPIMWVVTALTALFTITSKVAQAKEEARRRAEELYNSLQEEAGAARETSNSLKSLVLQYKELADSYDGAWNSEEFSKLETIQSNITELVGEQADNLDLVNGKIDEEYQKLLGIYRLTADESFKKTESAYLAAKQKFEGGYDPDKNWYGQTSEDEGLAQFYITRAYSQLQGYVEPKDYNLWWGEQARLEDTEWLGSVNDALGQIESYYDGLEKLREWRDLIVQAENSETGFGYWSTNYKDEQVWNAYDSSEALGFLNAKIDEFESVIAEYEGIKEDYFGEKANQEVLDYLTSNDIDTQQQFTDWVNKIWNDDSISKDYAESLITSMANYLLGFTIPPEIKRAFIKDRDELLTELNSKMPEVSKETFGSWIDGLTDAEYQAFVDWWAANQNQGFADFQSMVDAFNKYRKINETEMGHTIENVVPQSEIDKVDTLTSKIKTIQDVLNSQTTGQSISVEDFNSEELDEFSSALEYNNGVMQLNAEKVREIVNAKTEEAIATNNANKSYVQSKYLQNAAEIEKLRKKLVDKNFAEGESADTVQENIDALLDENASLKLTCDTYDLMTASLEEATNAYNNWLNAQNSSQSGDMFDDTLDAINRINETLNNSDSEFFGRVGRTDYKAAIDLIIPESIDQEDTEKVNSYLNSVYDLFTYDDDGNYSGLNIANFCQKAVDAGLMVLDESGENYRIAGSKTMEDFAEGLNLSLPLVQAMFGEMEEFGGEFSWADEANKTIGDLAVSANVAAENLRGLHSDMTITLDVSEVGEGLSETEKLKAQFQSLDSTIKQMQDLKATVGVDAEEVEYANSIISYCITQKQQLYEPAILDVDVSKVSETTGEAVLLIQDFQKACNDLELKKALGLDTTDAQAKVDELYSQITSSDNDALLALKLDTTSVETVKSSIAGLTIDDIKTKLQIDDTALLSYQSEDKQATVTYGIDTTKVDNYNPKNLSRTVTYYVRTVGSVKANGTANLTGTAKAGGDWGTAQGGQTLTGELGREIVVDPHTGRWYTVGDTGAEFVNIPRGAIVFNHKQTESLLKNGYVAGRASALVGGTAMVTGGIGVGNANNSTTSGGNSTSNYGKTSNSSSNKSSSSDDDKIEAFDWIEIAIDRLSRAVEKFGNIVDDTSKSFAARNKALEKEINATTELIKANEKAALIYIQEANSVNLSSNLKKKVREGDYNISDYNSDTAELINKYKEFYDKYLDAVSELTNQKANKSALQMEKFELTQQKYDSKFDLQDAKVGYYENFDEQAEFDGKGGSIKAQENMISVYERRNKLLKEEQAELEAIFNSGLIKKGTEDWYAMQTKIQEVKAEVIATDNEIAKLEQRKIEIQYERFNDIADDYENRIALKDNRISYHEALNKQAELEGKSGSVAAQKTIISLNKDRVVLLEEEREKLREQLKNIKEGSDEWYEAKVKVQDINVDLIETENAIIEGQRAIDEINWGNFEKISTSYDSLDNQYETRIAYYEDSNTKHQLNGNQGSVYAQQKMMEWENSHLTDLNTELEELYAERSKYSKDDANWEKMTARIREVQDEIRDSENEILQYRNNALDILSARFQDIESLYDSKMSNIDHKINTLSSEMSALELQGYKVSAEYYEEQKKIEQNRVSVLERGIAEIQEAFDKAMESGEIKKYSQEWYDYQLGINAANEELQETNNKLLEIDKTIRDLDFENFEYLRETVAQLNEESDFYINLMSDEDMYDEKGNLTEEGMATLGLHGQNYNIYIDEAEKYGEELADIKKKIADDPNNTELINRERELAAAQRECVIAAQDEKMAMRNLVEDGINYQLDALQKLIDKYSEALDKAKDLHDYEKKVTDHTSEISSLRKQISAYSGDDSQEAKLKVQQLQTDLKEAEENLEETEYDRYISDQKDLLDEFYSNYEEILVAELDDIDTLIKGVVETINTNSGSINETLNGLSDKFGVSLSEQMKSIWGDETLDTVLSSYIGDDESGVLGKQTTINKTLDEIELDVERILNANTPKIDDEKQDVPIVEVPSSNNNTSNSDIRVETSTDKPEIDININDTTPNSNETPDTTNGTTNAALESLFGGVFGTLGDIFGSGATNATETEDENHELLRVGSIIDVTNSQPYGDKNGNKQIINVATRNGLPTEYVVDRIEGNYILAVNTQDSRYKYWFKDTDVDIKKYKNGGLVDYTGLAWVDGTRTKPETVLDAEDTKNLIKLRDVLHKMHTQELTIEDSNFNQGYKLPRECLNIPHYVSGLNNMFDKLLTTSNSEIPQNNTVTFGDTHISIDHVQDYNDFVTQLKRDPKFEKMIQSMSIDLLDGKSRLAKNKINW